MKKGFKRIGRYFVIIFKAHVEAGKRAAAQDIERENKYEQ